MPVRACSTALVSVGVIACNYPKPMSHGDAGSDARMDAPLEDSLDAPVDARSPRCTPTSPFEPPQLLMNLNTPSNDENPFLSQDELTLYFSSDRNGGYDLYEATRPAPGASFGDVAPFSGANRVGDDRAPAVSADRLTVYATMVGTQIDIGIAQRGSDIVAFPALRVAADINSAGSDQDAELLPSGRVLYLASDRAMSDDHQIYRSSKSGGRFGIPTLVGGAINMAGSDETSPTLTPDELTMVFSSNRGNTIQNYDIYIATRDTTADGFRAPIKIAATTSGDPDIAGWISADGCELYFTRFVVTPNQNYELYWTTRGFD